MQNIVFNNLVISSLFQVHVTKMYVPERAILAKIPIPPEKVSKCSTWQVYNIN